MKVVDFSITQGDVDMLNDILTNGLSSEFKYSLAVLVTDMQSAMDDEGE